MQCKVKELDLSGRVEHAVAADLGLACTDERRAAQLKHSRARWGALFGGVRINKDRRPKCAAVLGSHGFQQVT